MTTTVGIVHTGRANLASVRKAFDHLGAETLVCESPEQLAAADRVVLPGVGAFRDSMDHLHAAGFPDALEAVRTTGRPILGLCLGMQLLCTRSTEGGESAGLGWIDADVHLLTPPELRVPHMGWNDVVHVPDSPLFKRLPDHADLYFVHSYHAVCNDEHDIDAWCDYGGRVVASVRHDNVAGMQFHPEKSQDHGLALLDAFLDWEP